jgi:hypothetical protein
MLQAKKRCVLRLNSFDYMSISPDVDNLESRNCGGLDITRNFTVKDETETLNGGEEQFYFSELKGGTEAATHNGGKLYTLGGLFHFSRITSPRFLSSLKPQNFE